MEQGAWGSTAAPNSAAKELQPTIVAAKIKIEIEQGKKSFLVQEYGTEYRFVPTCIINTRKLDKTRRFATAASK